jgi:Protein phosphatase 2C
VFSIGNQGRAAAELADGALPQELGPADVELSGASAVGAIVRAASCRGLAHQASGTPRQDAFAICREKAQSGRLIAVVCDGVGAFSRSHEAATLVSRGVAERAAGGLSWVETFALVNRELHEFAAKADDDRTAVRDARPGDMATTAVAVTVARVAEGWTGEVAWVGDSRLWHLDNNSQWHLLTQEKNYDDVGLYHSTTTRVLPSSDGACTSQEFMVSGGALFIMTDGVGLPLSGSREVQGKLAEWWSRPPDPLTFAGQVAFARRSHTDDRTVIGIWSA